MINLVEVVNVLIGDIMPIGETTADGKAYINLEENMSDVAHECITKLIECAKLKDEVAYSISRSGRYSHSILQDLKEQIDDYFEEL